MSTDPNVNRAAPAGQSRPSPFADSVRGYLAGMVQAIAGIDPAAVANAVEVLWRAWEDDRAVFIIGNGGSASTATHAACDLAKQTQLPGRRPLRAVALTDNVALISAFANDVDYSQVFAEQLNIYARPGDVLVAISCSGRSPNVVRGIDMARDIGLTTVSFGGVDGGDMRALSDIYVHVPAADYGYIETAHVAIEHVLTSVLFQYGKMTMESTQRPAVFVDRDGVLVRNRHDYVKSWDEVEILPGSLEALALLSRAGHRVFVITNQSALGRGLLTESTLNDIHGRLAARVEELGGSIEAFLVCPHRPDENCACRKPAPGLLLEAQRRYGVDLERTVMIGDHETDLLAAANAGVRSILVLSGRTSSQLPGFNSHVAPDLARAAEHILAN